MEKFWTLLFITTTVYVVQSAHVTKRMVDLTYVFDNNTNYHPLINKFEIRVVNDETLKEENHWFLLEDYSSSTHAGTHMDSPCHFVKGTWCIDDIPLEKFIAPAAIVDIERQSDADPDYVLTVDDLEEWENTTGHSLDHVILFIRTGWGKKWHDLQLYRGTTTDGDTTKNHHPGICPHAAQWLVDHRNIYGVGLDVMSLDQGIHTEFAAHLVFAAANIYGLENVANLDQMPLYGAKVYVMPMKIASASGAPTRIIATYPDIVFSHGHS